MMSFSEIFQLIGRIIIFGILIYAAYKMYKRDFLGEKR